VARSIIGPPKRSAAKRVCRLNQWTDTNVFQRESTRTPRAEDTDWPQVLALYGVLKRMSDNPMVALNHAIAAAMVHGPTAGLELLAPLDADERLRGHHRLDAVRAHLLERAGDRAAAVSLYRAAAEKTTNVPERNYLMMRAARLSEAP
jgi:predicted RNA polymerase sigma factor